MEEHGGSRGTHMHNRCFAQLNISLLCTCEGWIMWTTNISLSINLVILPKAAVKSRKESKKRLQSVSWWFIGQRRTLSIHDVAVGSWPLRPTSYEQHINVPPGSNVRVPSGRRSANQWEKSTGDILREEAPNHSGSPTVWLIHVADQRERWRNASFLYRLLWSACPQIRH